MNIAENVVVFEGVNPAISNSNLIQLDSVVVLEGVALVAQVSRLGSSEVGVLNCGLNSKPDLSFADNMSAPCDLAMNDVPCMGAELSGSPIYPTQNLIGFVVSSPMVVESPDVVSSFVNLALNMQFLDQSDLTPNDGFEGNVNFINILISVMSNIEMKAHMAEFRKNSILCQTDWLILENSLSSSSGGEEMNFQDFKEEIIECSIYRDFSNAGGKKHKSKGKKK
ncbi:hypothetical protein MA16_Dca007411 [Dendrobium catenatum]|uniref:Uncharacterized protein n=1 Tax=Dendrobium catenatum TaxID=906689 RepID=A0A2I0W8Q8_9ASPA|nr:hypothetical protein MA16_Dca007411 [Dendrobium catenatum]